MQEIVGFVICNQDGEPLTFQLAEDDDITSYTVDDHLAVFTRLDEATDVMNQLPATPKGEGITGCTVRPVTLRIGEPVSHQTIFEDEDS